jgi:hypothetical protein
MAEVTGLDLDVHFGKIDDDLPDWREELEEDDPDDEELEETPEDVVAVLGFDPKEFD